MILKVFLFELKLLTFIVILDLLNIFLTFPRDSGKNIANLFTRSFVVLQITFKWLLREWINCAKVQNNNKYKDLFQITF